MFEPQLFANRSWKNDQTLGTEGQNLVEKKPTPDSIKAIIQKMN
jgi:hypothetical protein